MINNFLRKLKHFKTTDLFKTSIGNGVATIIKLLAGLINNKIVAIYLGPSGVALLGQFMNFVEITGFFASFGINNGITKYTAEHSDNELNRRKVISSGFYVILAGTIIATCVVFAGRYYFSNRLFHTFKYAPVITVFALTLFLFTLNTFILAILNGFKEYKKIITRNIISSILGLIIAITLVIRFGLTGALYGTVVSQTIIFFIIIGTCWKSEWFSKETIFKYYDNTKVKALAKFTLMAFAGIVFTFMQLKIRTFIITNYSTIEAGKWQAIIRISSIYLLVITNTLIIYYLPKLSEIKEVKLLRAEIIKAYKFFLPITILGGLFIFIFKEFIVQLLFSKEFLSMIPFFKYQLIGDTLKIASWILTLTMLAKAMTLVYVTTDLVFTLIYYFLNIAFIRQFGVVGATYAYALHYFLYLCTLLFRLRNVLFIPKK